MNNNPSPVYYPQPQPEPPKEKNGAAVTSLIMGIIGLVFSCCCGSGLIFGIVGIITAIVSKSKSSTGKLNGMAIAGLIMSIISVVLGIIGLIWSLVSVIPVMVAGMESGGDFEDILEEIFGSLNY